MDYRAGQGKPYFGPGGCHGNQPAPGNVGKRGRKIRGTFQVETHVFMANDNIKKRPPILEYCRLVATRGYRKISTPLCRGFAKVWGDYYEGGLLRGVGV